MSTPFIAGVIGSPLAQTLSPVIFKAAFAAAGIKGDYGVFDTEDFDATVKRLANDGLRGLSVTIPHKQRAVEIADSVSESAARCNSSNLLIFEDGGISAHTTDGAGLIAALKADGFVVSGKRCFVIGCGGAGRAAVFALADAGASELRLFNRTESAAVSLAEGLIACGFTARSYGSSLLEVSDDVDLIVNATPVGMSDETLVIDLAQFRESRPYVLDMNYRARPNKTPLVRAAQELGFAAQDGLQMLVRQAIAAWPLMFSVEPPTEAMLNAVGLSGLSRE